MVTRSGSLLSSWLWPPLLLLAFPVLPHAFYVPGVSPVEFVEGDYVEIKVNSLTSSKTELPFDYYSLPMCRPSKLRRASENIGEIIAGDRIYNSLYRVFALKDEACKVLCRVELNDRQVGQFRRLVKEEYRVQWVVDNLPAVVRHGERYEFGFPLGRSLPGGKHSLNNHVHITMKYEEQPEQFEGVRVVGVEVVASSVRHEISSSDKVLTCSSDTGVTEGAAVLMDEPQTVVFSYSVTWEKSNVEWASRWEVYLHTADAQVHWFSIVNSLMIVLLLTGMVAMIMTRALRRDIDRYNNSARDPDVDESGWKLLSKDVFRAPPHFMWLAVAVGTGIQLLVMTFVVLAFAALGFLSPANRGGLLTATLVLFLFTSAFAGYYSSRFLKLFLADKWAESGQWNRLWVRCAYRAALFFPTLVFVPLCLLFLVASHEGSSIAVPVPVLLVIVVVWVCISTPLGFLGSYFGFKKQHLEVPCPPTPLPHVVPDRAWHSTPIVCMLIGGLLPFGTVFIELFFILSSVWLHQAYHVFGFLLVVLLILVVTCAEITIVLCYFQLCGQDPNWWWRAMYTSGATGLYLFAYSCFYFYTKLELLRFSSAVVFFVYTAVVCAAFSLATGTVGFVAAFLFVKAIFGAVKVD